MSVLDSMKKTEQLSANPPPDKVADKAFVINEAGLKLVEYYEGCFLNSYKDAVGVWTLAYGRINHDDGTPVGPYETCTQEQADAWLKTDLEREGAHFVRAWTKALNENQFSALTSFCYNRGSGRLKQLLGMPGDICTNMLTFDWAGTSDNRLLGLQRRRRSEAALYAGNDWTVFQSWHP